MRNDDLISRAALLAAYDAEHKGPPGGARKLIAEAPAVDAEPVLRCRECVYLAENPQGPMVCDNMRLFILRPNEFYCAAAARKGTHGGS